MAACYRRLFLRAGGGATTEGVCGVQGGLPWWVWGKGASGNAPLGGGVTPLFWWGVRGEREVFFAGCGGGEGRGYSRLRVPRVRCVELLGVLGRKLLFTIFLRVVVWWFYKQL